MVFQDETRFTLHPRVGRGWARLIRSPSVNEAHDQPVCRPEALMVSRARLSRFIRNRINDEHPGKLRDGLTDDISLLRSGILDSLALLELVAWIEREIGVPLDLTEIDFLAEWDTITGILNYISKHQKRWL